jgi:hypothetical protein
MANYLTQPFGTFTGGQYSASGVDKIFIAPRNKVLAIATTPDGTGTANIVTGFTMTSGTTFVELVTVEDSASLDQPFKTGFRKLITQTLAFAIDAAGADAIEAHNQLVLTRAHIAIVLAKDGKYYVAGNSYGLRVTDANSGTGAKAEDESGYKFTLGGTNLGPAPELQVSAADFETYVTRAQ